jgi:hypothetical protein
MTKNEITSTEFFIPKNVSYTASKNLAAHMDHKMLGYYHELRRAGWTFYVVDQSVGRCYFTAKVITIPVWALLRGREYGYWYISHEMAHAMAWITYRHRLHGAHFMECLKQVCPVHAAHYELGYKPMHATKAGIIKIPKDL